MFAKLTRLRNPECGDCQDGVTLWEVPLQWLCGPQMAALGVHLTISLAGTDGGSGCQDWHFTGLRAGWRTMTLGANLALHLPL